MAPWLSRGALWACLALVATPWAAPPLEGREVAADQSQIEFFEKRVRPLLATHCYECHSPRKEFPEAMLRLDSLKGILQGGWSGPAIVPGAPEESLLARAVSYREVDLRMPPDGKLADDEIEDLMTWIRMGPPSTDEAAAQAPPEVQSGIDLDEGRRFWSFQPVQDPPPPEVSDESWPRSSIDRFVLAALDANGLTPAAPADRRSWLRRVSFDLTGLPPAPEEIEAFVSDTSPQAHEAVVDRLLASPHYGERWGRHWLDLVRFAETGGHEYDNDKLDAWRYRDYVIRAFNQDVPYDQLVREHLAGDLMADKRLSPDGAHWESPLGTSFLWFGEVLNSPTDSVKSRADEVDNQLDVLSKAFQGMTVACARCHDHKFDPIPTTDYYALAGILHSTDISETVLDSPARSAEIQAAHQVIATANTEIEAQVEGVRPAEVNRLKSDLAAAARGFRPSAAEPEVAGSEDPRTRAWHETLRLALERPGHVFYPLASVLERAAASDSPDIGTTVTDVAEELQEHRAAWTRVEGLAHERGDEVFQDFERLDYGGWTVAGQAFGLRPGRRIPPNQPVRDHRATGLANSFGHGSDALVGSLTSPTFTMVKPWVHVRLAGSQETGKNEKARLRVTVVASGYKATHFTPTGNGAFQWQSRRVEELVAGRRCFVEIVDRSPEGHIAVDAIVFSDSKEPPPLASAPSPRVERMLAQPGLGSLPDLLQAYQHLFSEVAAGERLDRESQWLASALLPFQRAEEVLEVWPSVDRDRLRRLKGQRRQAAERLPQSVFGIVAREGTAADARLHIGGSHKNLGEEVERRYLQVIAGEQQPPVGRGSGRLELARRLVSPENPLTARVMVNRLWQHHFGRGLVSSTDNLGALGQRPTHPDLLDHLATTFVRGGWSIKRMHRLILLSSAYRMSSRADPSQVDRDPENVWLHHFPVRRLEAEAVRDSILTVSGQLDRRLFGPSIPPYITEFMDGRGKPESGPLDADGRRSVYIQVRRNFLTPFFLAFDYPPPISTMGRRGQSTVPSQALSLLNNAFVVEQAGHWGRHVTEISDDPALRVEYMFVSAYGRGPDESERLASLEFVKDQQQAYGGAAGADQRAWSDLGHVLLNSTEFIFLR